MYSFIYPVSTASFFASIASSVSISCIQYLHVTLPLFFMPFEPCITTWILELVPAPRMFPVTIWTLYTIPDGYSYMSGYQSLCQQVTVVHSTYAPQGAGSDQVDQNIDSLTQELMITQRDSSMLGRKHIYHFKLNK